MNLKVLISEGEDGWLVVQCPSIPGCISQGKTLEEALDNIKEAIEGCLEVMDERSKATSGKQMMEVVVRCPGCQIYLGRKQSRPSARPDGLFFGGMHES
ncbi:MAG: type II toxin-antitoxin system HicB family antitoxin [Methanothrix sp.]|nr:type II toxin-antitoxin system HicB family antitoxin [Methanothrix sp.]MDD4447998.1 type II toxin-antitoxin system HicB family antitoxin [Methanothrix sp.]